MGNCWKLSQSARSDFKIPGVGPSTSEKTSTEESDRDVDCVHAQWAAAEPEARMDEDHAERPKGGNLDDCCELSQPAILHSNMAMQHDEGSGFHSPVTRSTGAALSLLKWCAEDTTKWPEGRWTGCEPWTQKGVMKSLLNSILTNHTYFTVSTK